MKIDFRGLLTGTIAVVVFGLIDGREIPRKEDGTVAETYLEWISDHKRNPDSPQLQKIRSTVSHGTSPKTKAILQEIMHYGAFTKAGASGHLRPKRWARKHKSRLLATTLPEKELPTATAFPPSDGAPPLDDGRPGDANPPPIGEEPHDWWEDAEAKIIDGKVSRPNRWEWSVALISEQYDMGFVCGGTIIDLRWVITAAHCVHSIRDPGPLYAWVGAWNLTTHDYKDSVLVEEIIVHPNYQLTGSSLHDIALLKLVRPANVSFNSDDILTLPDPLLNLFELNPYCFIIGWGAFESNSDVLSTVLLEHRVNVISFVECQTRWDAGFIPVEIAHTNLCVDEGVDGDISACQGDSGSPLQCFDTVDRVWKLAGISSWGSGACSTFPSVYTKVSAFLDWIYATMYPAKGVRRGLLHE